MGVKLENLTDQQRRWLAQAEEEKARKRFLAEYRAAQAPCAVLVVPREWQRGDDPAALRWIMPELPPA